MKLNGVVTIGNLPSPIVLGKFSPNEITFIRLPVNEKMHHSNVEARL